MVSKSVELALKVIEYCKCLETSKNYVISNQLLKSSTSIGANLAESREAQSKKDFISKLSISSKEAAETAYWLYLCDKSEEIESPPNKIIDLNNELRKMLRSAIISLKTS